jgi:K+-sensing histidine kinase KdpD
MRKGVESNSPPPDRIPDRILDTLIPEQVQEKMGQPFFTSKEVGQGTGLGLSNSQGIAESHSGKL